MPDLLVNLLSLQVEDDQDHASLVQLQYLVSRIDMKKSVLIVNTRFQHSDVKMVFVTAVAELGTEEKHFVIRLYILVQGCCYMLLDVFESV